MRKRTTDDIDCKVNELNPQLKKRRRRTKQVADNDSSVKTRKLQFVGVAVVFLAGFFMLLAGTFSLAYHNSSSYREMLLGEVSLASGSEVTVQSFKISPTVATAREVKLLWPIETHLLESLTLKNVSADYVVGGLLGGSWKGTTLAAATGSLQLRSDGDQFLNSIDAGVFPEVESIRCNDLSVHIDENKEAIVLGTNAHFKWSGEPNKLLLTGGEINSELLKGFSLDQAFLRFEKDEIAISLRLEEQGGKGAVALVGSYDNEPLVNMQLSAERLNAKFLMGDRVGDLFRGRYNCEKGSLSLNLQDNSALKYSMNCRATDIELGRFDCFSVLAETLSKSWYRRPRFTDGGGLRVIKAGGVTSLENIKLEKKGALVLEGRITETLQGNMEGEMLIGIPSKYEPQLKRVFKSETFSNVKNGYVWVTVKLSGTSETFEDDLRGKLLARTEVLPITIKKSEKYKKQRKVPKTQEELESLFDELISK